ncbi:MAG: DUF3662 and FHA domain-containing protein [Acidimicrobiales bacterium]|nr:DUF3662 and FHA domain-containing protein [Acidimicrobiales bacterium]
MSFVVLITAGLVGARLYARRNGLAGVGELVRDVVGRLYPSTPANATRLQKAAWQGMRSQLMIGVDGTVAVPNRFEIALHPDDYDTAAAVEAWFVSGLTSTLARGTADHGWQSTGQPVIVLVADESRAPGVPIVRGRFTARSADAHSTVLTGARPVAADDKTVRAAGPLLVAGQGAWLVADGDALGRSEDCDIVIADSAVSGRHCRFEIDPSGGWAVIDLSSTNGTWLDGRRVPAGLARRLDDGAELGVGHTHLRFCLSGAVVDPASVHADGS